jgi:hypothetical protein
VVVAMLVTVAILGFSAVVPDNPPSAVVAGPTCAWRGSGLAGRPHLVRRWAFVDLAALSSGRWAAPPYDYARPGLVGNTIERCVAHVRAVPPPSGND